MYQLLVLAFWTPCSSVLRYISAVSILILNAEKFHLFWQCSQSVKVSGEWSCFYYLRNGTEIFRKYGIDCFNEWSIRVSLAIQFQRIAPNMHPRAILGLHTVSGPLVKTSFSFLHLCPPMYITQPTILNVVWDYNDFVPLTHVRCFIA
jgi:hypothetical protein